MILLLCSGSFLKGVLLRRELEVAGGGASAEVAAEDGNGAFDKGPGAVHTMHWSGAGIEEILYQMGEILFKVALGGEYVLEYRVYEFWE